MSSWACWLKYFAADDSMLFAHVRPHGWAGGRSASGARAWTMSAEVHSVRGAKADLRHALEDAGGRVKVSQVVSVVGRGELAADRLRGARVRVGEVKLQLIDG
ncbi:unnamed protein product [Pedinophyceae sp. YPF-701]|nr:unnamed protein product [Pedinophyceae sp. YPF-701]